MFTPKHYPPEVWGNYIKRGFRVNRFLARPAKEVDLMTADEFLRAGWGEILGNEDWKIDSCCLANIIMPQKSGIIRLKCDEDYFYITSQRNCQIKSIFQWQFTKCFKDFRLDELWANIVKMEKDKFVEFQSV